MTREPNERRAAAAADPAAGPAAEAVSRLLTSQGQWAELLAFLSEQVDRLEASGLDDPNLAVTALYRFRVYARDNDRIHGEELM